jgi:ribonuclease R
MNGKNKEERRVISEVVLKSMSRAFYDSKNFGHYGLAFECYGTFTSPARKVSDLLNHMVIETFLDEGYLSCKLDMYRSFIEDNCEYISTKQEDADSLEKEIQYLLLDCYADNFISVSSKARILFVNRYGIYVKDEHGLTGVIPLTKSMILYHNCVMYHGHEYFAGEQINVILKEKREDELIFDFGKVNDKKKVKKKD